MLFEQEQLYTKGKDSTVRLTDILSGRLVEEDPLGVKFQNDLTVPDKTEGRICFACLVQDKKLIKCNLTSGSGDDVYLLGCKLLRNRENELVTKTAAQCPRLYG